MSDCCNCPLKDLDDGCTSACVSEAFYKKGREDAIDECAEAYKELAIRWFESGRMTLGDIPRLAEELKEQKNGR